MTKQEFLSQLRDGLKGLPEQDIDERISFYSEMIDDRIDEGKSEQEAINEIGSVEHVVEEIAQETSLVTLVKERITPKRKMKAWEIVLLVVGFPLWFPLVLTAAILALVFYLLIWVFVIVVYAVELSLVVCVFGGIIIFFAYLFGGEFNLIPLAASIMSSGGAILLFFGCVGATKGTLKLSKKIITKIKKAFMGKGDK